LKQMAMMRSLILFAVLLAPAIAGVPAALKDWSLPVSQLGEAARYFRYDPVEARRLLARVEPFAVHYEVCVSTVSA